MVTNCVFESVEIAKKSNHEVHEEARRSKLKNNFLFVFFVHFVVKKAGTLL